MHKLIGADGLAALRQECEKKLWKAENDSAEDSFTTPAALEAVWPLLLRERQARAQAEAELLRIGRADFHGKLVQPAGPYILLRDVFPGLLPAAPDASGGKGDVR